MTPKEVIEMLLLNKWKGFSAKEINSGECLNFAADLKRELRAEYPGGLNGTEIRAERRRNREVGSGIMQQSGFVGCCMMRRKWKVLGNLKSCRLRRDSKVNRAGNNGLGGNTGTVFPYLQNEKDEQIIKSMTKEHEVQPAAVQQEGNHKFYDDNGCVIYDASCAGCRENWPQGFRLVRDIGPNHDGSRMCESGSLASGGEKVHCTCDVCF